MPAANLEVIISGDDRTGNLFGGLTGNLQAIGGLAAGAVVGGVAAVGAAAVLAARDFVGFDQQMREVFTLMPGITGEAMSGMTDQVKDFSTEFGVLPEEVVPALYQAISAGVPQDNVFSFLETAQKAAAGGVTDLTTAVDGISSVVNAYGDDVLNAGQASDLMFTAVKLGKTNFEELSASLFQVIPTASALGVEFGDVTAGLAAMTAQGTPTNVATTQMRQLFVELSKAGGDASDTFSDMAGVTFQEFIAQGGNVADALGVMEQAAAENGVQIQDLFGSVEAGNAALALTGGGAETFAANLEEMANAAGATDAAFEVMDASLGATIDRIKATGKVALLDFAEAFSPLLGMAADFAEDILPKLSAVLQDRIMPVIEGVVGAITNFRRAMDAGIGPVDSISMLMAELGRHFGISEETVDAFRRAFSSAVTFFQESIAPIIDAIGQFVAWKDVLIALGIAIGVAVAIIVGPLVLAVAQIALALAAVIAVVALLRNAWENDWGGIQGKVQAVIGFIVPLVTDAIANIKQWWAENGEAILAKAAAIWEAIKNAVNAAITFVQMVIQNVTAAIRSGWEEHNDGILFKAQIIWGMIRDFIQTAIQTIREIIVNVSTAIRDFWEAYGQDILTLAQGVWTAISDFIGNIFEQLSTALSAFILLFKGDWEGFGEAIGAMWRNAWDAIVQFLSTIWQSARPFLESLWLDISGWFSSIDWGSLGQRIVDGIIAGLWNAASALYGAVSGLIAGALGAGEQEAGAESPAKAFMPLGRDLSRGIAAGVSDGLGFVTDAIAGVIEAGAGWNTPGGKGYVHGVDVVGDIWKDPALIAAEWAAVGMAPPGLAGPPPTERGGGTQNNYFTLNVNSNANSEDIIGDYQMMQAWAGGV